MATRPGSPGSSTISPISSAVHWICGIFPFIVGDEADVKFTLISSQNLSLIQHTAFLSEAAGCALIFRFVPVQELILQHTDHLICRDSQNDRDDDAREQHRGVIGR